MLEQEFYFDSIFIIPLRVTEREVDDRGLVLLPNMNIWRVDLKWQAVINKYRGSSLEWIENRTYNPAVMELVLARPSTI